MRAIKPLLIMLYTLSYSAIPSWPLGIAAAVLWPVRVEVPLLSGASLGTFASALLLMLRRAEQRDKEYRRMMEEREAQYARLERELCGAVAELHPRGRPYEA